jgi:hypothetical protein
VAYDFASDLDTVFNTDELAETATYTRSGFPPTFIPVIFENEFSVTNEIGETGMGVSAPQAHCKTVDVANASRGDTLVVGGTTYYVQEVRPNGTGVTTLILSRDQ